MKVDFACIGAGKAGTTWLWKALSSHPEICLPEQKEIHYFNRETFEDPSIPNPNHTKPITWYHRQFRHAQHGQLLGDFSPSYLWSETAARLLHRYNPEMKILAILRDPVERTYSHYLYAKQSGLFVGLDFEQALVRFPFFAIQSEYGRMLRPYFELFPREQMKILFFEDMKTGPIKFLREVEAFLGVAERIEEGALEATNETGIPRFPRLNRLLTLTRVVTKRHHVGFLLDMGHRVGLGRLARRIRADVAPFKGGKPAIPDAMKLTLRQRFDSDVAELGRLLGRNLSHWRA